ncbi:MAG: hypothetical protein AAF901_09895, partial [Bacteroidota bacterium]
AVVLLYSNIKLKTSITKTFGLGDALLFLALAFTFANISFLVLFIFGLVFSLLLHVLLKHYSKFSTVPLAGYLSLFFAITYMAHWMGFLKYLYTI